MPTIGPLAGVGLPPDPARFTSWKEYATALSAFMGGQSRVGQAVQPQAVQLVHVNTADPVLQNRPRIISDGVLAFDPTLGVPVVSIGGIWKRFTLT